MIIRKQPLVKLLAYADQLYLEEQKKVARDKPYTYSPKSMLKCMLVKTLKRLADCSGLYNYLNHECNTHIREAVGLAREMRHLKTLQRRFEQSKVRS